MLLRKERKWWRKRVLRIEYWVSSIEYWDFTLHFCLNTKYLILKYYFMGMHNFRELKMWQRSMDFVQEVYLQISDFPLEENMELLHNLNVA